MASSRSILLVHGAWHGAWCWAALQADLDRRGIPSYAIDLPGHGASPLEPSDLYGDAAHVAAVIGRITEQHETEIVLVGHSYGGAVISQATATTSAVAHLVYLTAFCLDEGEAVLPKAQSMPTVQTELGSAMQILPDGSGSMILTERAPRAFYGCCAAGPAAASAARLCVQPLATFTQPVTVTPWKTIPSTYVRCLRDEAIHISHQDLMAVHCSTTTTIDTDHSPFLSAVTETADILEHLARG
jgi:pimeloyl-ACP methyl ester carboxylesterase